MNNKLIKFITLLSLILVHSSALSEKLSEAEITERFSGKTMDGDHTQRSYLFKRYYDPDGEVIDISNRHGERIGVWKTKRGKLCHKWNGRKKGKCRDIHADGDALHLYDHTGEISTMVFKPIAEGNKLDEIETDSLIDYR